jgi:putative membrane protein
MIRNFSDHAANERTFLAWVRTAIAVMAFGFVVERFGLFLATAAAAIGGHVAAHPAPRFSGIAGLALIVLGMVIVAVAAVRFIATAKEIDDPQPVPGPGSRFDLALAALLFLLGLSLTAYLAFSLTGAT